MSPSGSTPDVRAVVRALDALTTQVKRLANHTANPASFALAPPVADDRDAPTTPLPSPRIVQWIKSPATESARTALEMLTKPEGCKEHPNAGSVGSYCLACIIVPAPAADGPRCVECGSSAVRYRNYLEQPFCWPCANGEKQAPDADEDACLTHNKGACDGTTRDCVFPAPGSKRRRSLRVLLNRLNNGIPLTPDEAQLLTRHVATEITEANQWRAGRNTMKQRGEEIERDRDNFAEELTREQAASAGLARKIREQRTALDTAHRRAEQAETELRVLRTGLRAAGGDPTQIQNLWAQIRLRNRQWREEKQRVRRLETAARQVLDICGEQGSDVQDILRTALDGTEQPTTEA